MLVAYWFSSYLPLSRLGSLESDAIITQVGKYQCGSCGYVYDPEKDDPDNSVAPGTAFENLPDDRCCPNCGVSKNMFEKAD